MKYIELSLLLLGFGFLASCNDTIDLLPQSNGNTSTYYSNLEELNAGLAGCYNGLQRPMYFEWQLTEMRSDNTKMGTPGSQSAPNRDLSDLDMFIPATIHQGVYTYWLNTYNNIRNANIILDRLGVTYDPAAGSLNLGANKLPITETERKQVAGEALFIRAYHYFNLVRLYGGVFLVHKPITATEVKTVNRSSVEDIYKLIEADLKSASTFLSAAKFSAIPAANLGRTNAWAAKGLLGKVYLTRNKKADAITQLQDVITNSGYSLLPNYADVFSITNEMNAEILFAVRYKAGGFGLGATFGNDFAPVSSGVAIINGDGDGNNYPTFEMDTAHIATDKRKVVNMALWTTKYYVKKFVNQVVLTDDGEGDWPVLRYSDVLLMMAEAKGFTPESIALINQIRKRAGLADLPATVTTVALFEKALADERRFELAFENQRYFDLLRFNTTMTTITAEQTLKNHFAIEYRNHYGKYPAPIPTLAQLQANVNANRLLLPIPQREIDTNRGLKIEQNPGY